MSDLSTTTETVQNYAIDYAEFVAQATDRYHDHKERMAYLPLAAYALPVSAGIVTAAWLPESIPETIVSCFLVLFASIWVFMMCRWQLDRRESAAEQNAAACKARADWISCPPEAVDLLTVLKADKQVRDKLHVQLSGQDNKSRNTLTALSIDNYPVAFAKILLDTRCLPPPADYHRKLVLLFIALSSILLVTKLIAHAAGLYTA